MRRALVLGVAILAASTLGVVGSAAASGAAKSPTTLKVTLLEFKIKPRPKTVPAGKVKLVAKNIGSEEHEVVIARVAVGAVVVTKADGSVDEKQIAAADKVGEIEGVKPKQTKTKVFDLTPGTYLLFCNTIDDEPDGSKLSHYAQGMSKVLTVT